jgi:UDP-galactopyranose mutase
VSAPIAKQNGAQTFGNAKPGLISTGFIQPDWLVVGAGFTGATVARKLAEEFGARVLVVDRRPHIAGNAFDERNEAGITVHRYGAHVFHTNSERIWNFVNRFGAWRCYEHRVRCVIDRHRVPVPFNLASIRTVFSERVADVLQRKLIAGYGMETHVPVLTLRQTPDADLARFGEYVYDNVFLNYTVKQWGLRPEQLAPHVTARVPVRISEDDRYFQDVFQAMPTDGYTAVFRAMLDHPNIRVETSVEYRDLPDALRGIRTVFTGPIDEYFGYAHGRLPYRSLRFEVETLDMKFFQEVGTVNYPGAPDITRITEQKRLSGESSSRTTIVREYPQAHVAGVNEPFYPVPTESSSQAIKPYQAEARRLSGRTWFAGRLADYQYYNMDQACARGHALVDKEIKAALDK